MEQMWGQLKKDYPIQSNHSLKVMRKEKFGLFLDLGYADTYDYKLTGLMERFKRGESPGLARDTESWPEVGSMIEVIVVSYRGDNMEIDFKLSDN